MSDLRQSVISGLRWSAFARAVVQTLTWIVTIVVVRLLTPHDYGVAAMAGLVTGYLTSFNELGLSVALVQRRIEDERTLRSVFGVLLLTGFVLCGVLLAMSPFIAAFFGEPGVTMLVQIASLQFLTMAFTTIPQARLATELRFRELSKITFASNVAGAATTLTLAYLGFGAAALVIGTVTINASRAVAANWMAPFLKLPRFELTRLRGLMGFSSLILAERSLWYAYADADQVVVGRTLGSSGLGLYSLALTLATIPMQRAGEIINQVALPAYASIQHELERVRAAYVKSFRMGCALTFPVFWGIAMVVPDVVGLVLGPKWVATIPIIRIICIAMPVKALGMLASPALTAIGKPGVSIRIIAWGVAIVPLSIFIGARWDILGVAIAWAVVTPVVFLIGNAYVTRALGMAASLPLGTLVVPAVSGAAMCAAILLAHAAGLDMAHSVVRLLIDIILGAVTYLLALRVLPGARLNELVELGRSLVGMRSQHA